MLAYQPLSSKMCLHFMKFDRRGKSMREICAKSLSSLQKVFVVVGFIIIAIGCLVFIY